MLVKVAQNEILFRSKIMAIPIRHDALIHDFDHVSFTSHYLLCLQRSSFKVLRLLVIGQLLFVHLLRKPAP